MTSLPLTTVLLDVDGTLLDSNDAHAAAWVEALRRHGHDLAFERLRAMIGKGGDKVFAELLQLAEDSPEALGISATRMTLFMTQHLPTLKPTTGARDLLQRLRASGLRPVVATSSGSELPALLKQAGVDDLVDAAASSGDADRSKPDPDIVQAALRKAGTDAAQAVLIGDTPYDIEAAATAGVAAIALRCGGWWNDDALAGAVAIYNDPADLLRHWGDSPLARAGAPGAAGG